MANGDAAEQYMRQAQAQQQAGDPANRQYVRDETLTQKMNQIDLGFGLAGTAFGGSTTEAAQAWKQYGQNITSVMQQRWFQKEFENFEAQYLQPYTQQLNGLNDSLMEKVGQINNGMLVGPDGQVVNIDPDSVQAARLKGDLMASHTSMMGRATNDLMGASMKYGAGNPLIAARIQGIAQATANEVDAIFNPQQVIEGEKGFADVSKQQAEVATERERPEAVAAGADLARAQAWRARHEPFAESGADWERAQMDPVYYMDRYGPDRLASYLATSDGAERMLGADFDAAMGQIQRQAIEKVKDDPKLAANIGLSPDGTVQDADKYAAFAASQKGRAMAMAAISLAKRMPDTRLMEELGKIPSFRDYLKDPSAQITKTDTRVYAVPAAQTRKELTQNVENLGTEFLREIEDMARRGEVNSRQDVIEAARQLIATRVQPQQDNAATRRQTQKFVNELINFIGENWSDRSSLLRAATGEASVLSKIPVVRRLVE